MSAQAENALANYRDLSAYNFWSSKLKASRSGLGGKMRAIAAALVGFVCLCTSALAQECGDPPNLAGVDRRVEDIQADIKGKAGALARRILDADVSGQIKATRNTFYQGSDAAIAAQKDNYFCYTLCTLVRDEKSLPFAAKLNALRECSSKPTKNTINIKDATYASRWHPNKRGGIMGHLLDQCQNKTECQFACDNHRSGAGDVSKGDSSKWCIINYSCSNKPNDGLNATVSENEHGTYPLSCPN